MQLPLRISIHAPTRGATGGKDIIGGASEISIHAPTRGATDECRAWKEKHNAFQSTLPRGERPNCFDHCQGEMDISIHAPTRGATFKDCYRLLCWIFQSTLPRGERHRVKCKRTLRIPFQSTLPRGERLLMFCLIVPLLNFNPRSHEGSDILPVPPPAAVSISIHAPTRGATTEIS